MKSGPKKQSATTTRSRKAATQSAPGIQSRSRRSSSAPVRLEDVARFAGVSTASVSRAFNSPDLVSVKLRERVSRAAQVLDWVPNGAAQALASQRSRIIGALIPTLGHQNFATLVEALQHGLATAHYTLIIGCVETSAELRVQQTRKMIERGIECLVLVGEAQPPPLFDLLRTQNVPYVITYTSGREPGNTCIGFDNYAASAGLTQHLLDLGHRKFALITAPSDENDRLQQRVAGLRDTLAKAGLAIRPKHYALVESSRKIASGREGLRAVLKEKVDRPTALICTNDYVATGALIEAKALRIAVPRVLSIVGFDDVDLSAHLDPPLTTIRVPARAMGEEIAKYLIRLLDTGAGEVPPPLKAELVIRGSTAAPRAD